MATTTKKGSKNKKAKPRRPVVKTSVDEQAQTTAELRQQLAESLQREKTTAKERYEALEQQRATSEILRVIAGSPGNLQTVLDTIAENAARLCDADDVLLRRTDGVTYQTVSHFGPLPHSGDEIPVDIGSGPGRAILERRIVHVHDVQKAQDKFPGAKLYAIPQGVRTALAVPLLRNGVVLGVFHLRRLKVQPFADNQISLLQTFADQAVIAIENARLFQELTEKSADLEKSNSELRESLEQQTATSEILGVIASSPTDIQPVLDVVAENAARLCEATDAVIHRIDGDKLRSGARYGLLPTRRGSEPLTAIDRGSIPGRAVIDRRTLHIHDLAAEPEDELLAPFARSLGVRTVLATPLLREGIPIGTIHIRRMEVRPFTEKQIKLLETFAAQAVIAIENVRLFEEIQERNAELREALEHQTATSEVLAIISRSPTDVQPVLDAIVESAVRVCGIDDVVLRLHEGNQSVLRAHFGPVPDPRSSGSIDGPQFNWIREHGTLHIPDVRAQTDFSGVGSTSGSRTFLFVPLRQQGALIGALVARRIEVRPFTPAQIKLLETFADQAVIAIENVRLFNELKESLEQQTATSKILGVIASSPTDIQPVLDIVAKTAAQLCDAGDAAIWRTDGQEFWLVASHGSIAVPQSELRRPMIRSIPSGRAMVDKETVHIHDIMALESRAEFSDSFRTGEVRTILTTPLIREGVAIGAIHVRRPEVRPFTDKQIALLKTFADQAVIAIENVRLFKEIQERNAELREALEHQTATSEVLSIISRSPTDVQPVLDAIVESAARVCGIEYLTLRLREGSVIVPRAHFGSMPTARAEISVDEPWWNWMREHGTLHVPDTRAQDNFTMAGYRSNTNRTFLAVPLRQKGELIGTLIARRTEVRPFTPAQIKLLETFADQAVIAIENVRLFQELKESLEQQTATSEILGVIASSPTDIQPVLDAIALSAARVCGSDDATIRLLEGDEMILAAHFGTIPPGGTGRRTLGWRSVGNEALLQRRTIHIPDLQAEAESFPDSVHIGRGIRTFLVTPLLREGTAIGVINIRRTEVKPFTDKQVALLETFASQAVIAIENVRLFNELKESLEQQTATSEILGVIASSPTELQPVLDVVAENAARLCDANDAQIIRVEGDAVVPVATYGTLSPAHGIALNRRSPSGRAILDRQTLHIHDLATEIETEFPEVADFQKRLGHRTTLATPLLREGVSIGAILIRRLEVRPFTEKHIKLLETFAAQAVIAIENVRLFKELQERNAELREALEHQTATAEVLGIISRSPTDVQPVLDAIVESAARVCGLEYLALRLREGSVIVPRAHFGSLPTPVLRLVLTSYIFAG